MTANVKLDIGIDTLFPTSETEDTKHVNDMDQQNDGEVESVVASESRFSTITLESLPGNTVRSVRSSIADIKGIHDSDAESASLMDHQLVDRDIFSENNPTHRLSLVGRRLLDTQIDREHKKREEESIGGVQKDEREEDGVDWDFWGLVMSDYHGFARDHSDQLARAIERGIPHTLRGMVWQLMAGSKDHLLEADYVKHMKETTSYEKAITRDLGRTFPHHEYFMEGGGIGQENLFNVLKAYAIHDTQVGYCQGLPFITAILLLNMPDEETFCLLVRLMESYDLRSHFLPEMPGLQLRLFQFDRLLEEQLPVLHLHFLRQGVKSSMYASQWFLTMFSYRFPLEIVFRIFDNCLANGIEAMFRFALILLRQNEDILLTLKFDDILAFLKTHLLDRYRNIDDTNSYRVHQFVQDAFQIRLSSFTLDNYAAEWTEAIRIRDAHAVEMDELRNTNRMLAMKVRSLEESSSRLNEDHCEVAKALVLLRLQNEELECELVRYKLLYADAMHRSESDRTASRLSAKLNPSLAEQLHAT